MNTKAINFIETLGYTTKSYETRYDGNTPVADSLLGIKYVLNDPARNDADGKSLLSPYYNLVYTSTYEHDQKDATLEVYENPDALPIGFMADDDILRLSFLGNDNPFNSMNNFLSSLTGNTPDYSGALEPRQYFWRIEENPEVELNECWESNYNGQHCYNANAGAGDPTVRIHITTQSDDCLYMFLKSDNPKKCNLWVSDDKNPETGEFEQFKGFGQYYDGYDYSIVNLGSYPTGTELEIRMTIIQGDKTGNNEYIMIKDFQFYHFNYDLFHEDILKLKESPWDLDLEKTRDDYLVGDVDVKEGQILYTSIPYEPGWTIKVDGKKLDPKFEDTITDSNMNLAVNETKGEDGEYVVLNALIGLRLPEGHHTVTMKYSPPGFRAGILFLILGIGVIVLFFIVDRKNNIIYAQERTNRELRRKGIDPETYVEEAAAPAKIIKSKGAVAEKVYKSEEEKKKDAAVRAAKKAKAKAAREAAEKAKAEAERAAAEAERAAAEAEEDIDDFIEDAADVAEEATETVTDAVGDVAEEAAETAEEVAEEVSEAAEKAVKKPAQKNKKKKK